MHDEMSADKKRLIDTEDSSVKGFEGLMAAEKKLVAALTKSIEEKTGCTGEMGGNIDTKKNDPGDTQERLAKEEFAEQRKADYIDYKDLMQSNTAAKEFSLRQEQAEQYLELQALQGWRGCRCR